LPICGTLCVISRLPGHCPILSGSDCLEPRMLRTHFSHPVTLSRCRALSLRYTSGDSRFLLALPRSAAIILFGGCLCLPVCSTLYLLLPSLCLPPSTLATTLISRQLRLPAARCST